MSFNMSKLKDFGASALTFGKRNAPSIMTGGGIVIGWIAAYVFWKQGKKAEEKIRAEEEKLNEGNPSDAPENREKLPKKDKIAIYLQYCWAALALGIGSSGLTIWAHKIDLARLAEMYMVTQFLEKKNEDQEKLLNKLKDEVGEKKVRSIENEILEEDYPDDELIKAVLEAPGKGRTLFADETRFGARFRSDIDTVKNGIYEFDDIMANRYGEAYALYKKRKQKKSLKEKMKDPFFASDNPYTEDNDDDVEYGDVPVYVEATLNELYKCLGQDLGDNDMGNKIVIRYYGSGLCINPNDDEVMRYKDFTDPDTGTAQFCRLNFNKYLIPGPEFEDRRW